MQSLLQMVIGENLMNIKNYTNKDFTLVMLNYKVKKVYFDKTFFKTEDLPFDM